MDLQAVACYMEPDVVCHKPNHHLNIFLSKWQPTTVLRMSESASFALLQLGKRHLCCVCIRSCCRASCEASLPLISVSNKSLVFAAVNYAADIEQRPAEREAESHAGLRGYIYTKPESNPSEDMILIWLFIAREGEEGSTWCRRGSVRPPSLRFSHLNTAQHKHTHTHRLKRPAVPSATLMPSFILLRTNVNLCQPPSLPLFFSPFSRPPHLHQLISPTLHVSSPLCLLPCLLPHSFLHP